MASNHSAEADPDDRLPEISEAAVTASAIYGSSQARVLCGNSLSTASYERLMEAQKPIL